MNVHDAALACVLPAAADGSKPWGTVESRFWPKVDKSGTCWLWTAKISTSGYGRFHAFRREWAAHRVSWFLAGFSIPATYQLDHLCRVRRCVRSDHMEPVDCQTNLLRGETLAAANAAKTHCIHGHPFDESNLLIKSGTKRNCRECNRLDCARRRAQKKIVVIT